LQDPPKFTQIGIFGLKTNHLATLIYTKQPIAMSPATSLQLETTLFLNCLSRHVASRRAM
jgi:hypothetical protein